jgi:hypothetical protein
VERGQSGRNHALAFWGVSRLEGEPKSARTEALITVVGPLTSFLAGFAVGLIGSVAVLAGRPRVVERASLP